MFHLCLMLLALSNYFLLQNGKKNFKYHTWTDLNTSYTTTNYQVFAQAYVDTFEAVTVLIVTREVSRFYNAQGRGGGNSCDDLGAWYSIGY